VLTSSNIIIKLYQLR